MEPAVRQVHSPSRARKHRSPQRTAWWWRVWVLLPWVVGLGMLTSVAVSALAGLRFSLNSWDWYASSDGERGSIEADDLSAVVFERTGVSYLNVSVLPVDSPDLAHSQLRLKISDALAPFRAALLDPRSQSIGGAKIHLFATGFPIRCFQGADFPDAWPEPVTIGLIKFGVFEERVICYQPRWIALALDTLFWGAIWMGVILIPLATRRARRRRRGLCPECAYDLRGDLTPGCPECGWNREPAAVSFPT